ncbi:MAG: aspartate dehydrogenase [Candidatus Omnitrophota bacterium]|nr:MAG: aspartate dehydrogenase [Candidatus Omnitrophota bacterium]
MIKIGIVGCGAIGSSLARSIVGDFKHKAALAACYDSDPQKSKNLACTLHKHSLVAKSLGELIRKSDLLIEATCMAASFSIAQKAIRAKKDIIVLSVGGLLTHAVQLSILLTKHKSRVYLPSGAICGIDGLKAAACGRITKVTLTTTKHPLSLKGAPYFKKRKIDLGRITKERLVFQGSALEAIEAFPQNINVAAVLSMAGLGPQKTQVRIIASPRSLKNVHEVRIESDAATICTRTENVLHPKNPKTSFLAVVSALSVLKQIVSGLKIGT